jgi:hypothetical protein
MQIKIPLKVAAAFDACHDWGYTPMYTYKGYSLRRVDPLIGLSFLFCTSYYYYYSGWLGAAQGGATFIFIALCAMWFF